MHPFPLCTLHPREPLLWNVDGSLAEDSLQAMPRPPAAVTLPAASLPAASLPATVTPPAASLPAASLPYLLHTAHTQSAFGQPCLPMPMHTYPCTHAHAHMPMRTCTEPAFRQPCLPPPCGLYPTPCTLHRVSFQATVLAPTMRAAVLPGSQTACPVYPERLTKQSPLH